MRVVERCNRAERSVRHPSAGGAAARGASATFAQRREAERERRLAPRDRAAKLAEPECPRS
jgi:hypothetical protein